MKKSELIEKLNTLTDEDFEIVLVNGNKLTETEVTENLLKVNSDEKKFEIWFFDYK